MQNEKAKALNYALEKWMNLPLEILSSTEFSIKKYEKIEEAKEEFEKTDFEQLYEDFIQELKYNIELYKNIEYIDTYMESALRVIMDGFEEYDINDIKNRIIRNGFEVHFLLSVTEKIHANYNRLEQIIWPDDGSIYSSELKRIFSEKMLEFDPDFSIKKILEPTEDLDLPDDSEFKFMFDFFKIELDAIESDKEKLKLIQNRLIDYEQWFIRNEPDIVSVWEEHDFNKLEFVRLCRVEIKRYSLDNNETNSNANFQKVQTHNEFKWTASDTALIELICSIYQEGAIQRKNGNPLKRKELMDYFQQLFSMEIKDVEGKLNKATNRKINMTPFLDSLKVAFKRYAEEKFEKQSKR